MVARILKYSDNWSAEILVCPSCGWRGGFEQGRTIAYPALVESSCPKCDFGVLAMLPFPSETRATPLGSERLDGGVRAPGGRPVRERS